MGVHGALRKMRIFYEFWSLIGGKEYVKIFMILEIIIQTRHVTWLIVKWKANIKFKSKYNYSGPKGLQIFIDGIKLVLVFKNKSNKYIQNIYSNIFKIYTIKFYNDDLHVLWTYSEILSSFFGDNSM